MNNDHVLLDLGVKYRDTKDEFYKREIIRNLPENPLHGTVAYMAWMGFQRLDPYWAMKFYDEVDRHQEKSTTMHPDARAAIRRAHEGKGLTW